MNVKNIHFSQFQPAESYYIKTLDVCAVVSKRAQPNWITTAEKKHTSKTNKIQKLGIVNGGKLSKRKTWK